MPIVLSKYFGQRGIRAVDVGISRVEDTAVNYDQRIHLILTVVPPYELLFCFALGARSSLSDPSKGRGNGPG